MRKYGIDTASELLCFKESWRNLIKILRWNFNNMSFYLHYSYLFHSSYHYYFFNFHSIFKGKFSRKLYRNNHCPQILSPYEIILMQTLISLYFLFQTIQVYACEFPISQENKPERTHQAVLSEETKKNIKFLLYVSFLRTLLTYIFPFHPFCAILCEAYIL